MQTVRRLCQLALLLPAVTLIQTGLLERDTHA
jgi:hypothetical protein